MKTTVDGTRTVGACDAAPFPKIMELYSHDHPLKPTGAIAPASPKSVRNARELLLAATNVISTGTEQTCTDIKSSPHTDSTDDPALLIGLAIALLRHGLGLSLPPALLDRLKRLAADGDLACQALLDRHLRLKLSKVQPSLVGTNLLMGRGPDIEDGKGGTK